MEHSFIIKITNEKVDEEHTDITYTQLEFKDEKIAEKQIRKYQKWYCNL